MSELERAVAPDADIAEALLALGNVPVATIAEARAVCAALSALPACGEDETGTPASALYMLASLFQRVTDEEVYRLLQEEGIPRLVEIFDARVGPPAQRPEELLFLLKIFAMYPSDAGLERITAAARAGLGAADPLWSVIFRLFDQEHSQQGSLLEALRSPLPRGFAAVAYLDFCNALAYEDCLDEHPFDAAPGPELLEAWLSDPDPAGATYAHSATASLPFLGGPARERLLELALAHADSRVQLEAAWAAGRLGDPRGVERLSAACLDSRLSHTAQEFLFELDRAEAVPAAALEPAFAAEVELCAWLAHPREYARPPEHISLLDERTLYWPPSGDERSVRLFAFSYPSPQGQRPASGVGMVGSITFSLFGETSPEQDPLDIYALHCCWELEIKGDPRAPIARSVEAGRRLLQASPQTE